jgi:hypothetical protein
VSRTTLAALLVGLALAGGCSSSSPQGPKSTEPPSGGNKSDGPQVCLEVKGMV